MVDRKELEIHNKLQHVRRLQRKSFMKPDLYVRGPVLAANFHDNHFARVQSDINGVLEFWFETGLVCAEENKAAELIYNPFQGPVIHLESGRYGIKETRTAIELLSNAESVLLEESAQNSGITSARRRAFRKNTFSFLEDLPYPLNVDFHEELVYTADASKLSRLVRAFRETLEMQVSRQPQGNARAYRTALAVRAAYEHYCMQEITVGYDESCGVTGRYCRCLEEIYDLVGLSVKVLAYAEKARRCPEVDPTLSRYRSYFQVTGSDLAQEISVYPLIFTRFGWVQNMTNFEKSINSIAMNDKRLEHLLCYTKCSTETVSMTTKTTN